MFKSNVRHFVSKFITEMKRKSPNAVQKWVDSIALHNPDEVSSSTSATVNNAQFNATYNEESPPTINCDIFNTSTKQLNEDLLQENQKTVDIYQQNESVDCKKLIENKNEATGTPNNLLEKEKSKIDKFYEHLNHNKSKLDRFFPKTKRNILEKTNSIDLPDTKTITEMVDEIKLAQKLNESECLDDEKDSCDVLNKSNLKSNNNDTINSLMKFELESIPILRHKNINIGRIGRSYSENIPDDDRHDETKLCKTYCYSENNFDPNINDDLSFDRKNSFKLKNMDKQQSSFSDKSLKKSLLRDDSMQSDSSHCSSVESLLESRKPDPETILINLGFGPVETEDVLSKIPKRFLKPSQLKGIDTDAFVRQQKLASHVYENSVLGYRGLLGNPHITPSSIVAKIHQRFQENETNRLMADETRPLSAPPSLDFNK